MSRISIDWNHRTYRGEGTIITLEDCRFLDFCRQSVECVQVILERRKQEPTLTNVRRAARAMNTDTMTELEQLHDLRSGQYEGTMRFTQNLFWDDDDLILIAPRKWWIPWLYNHCEYNDLVKHRIVDLWVGCEYSQIVFFYFLLIRWGGVFEIQTITKGKLTQAWLSQD